MNKIKKGDDVIVTTGKDKGKRGTVSQVLEGKLIVSGINIAKKHQKGNPNAGVAGGIVEKELPIDISNVQLFNPKSGKGERVGVRVESGKKVRFFKSSKELVG
ncbi:MAG: 50S ribosomal protein L24 [Nevskiaceae bacterium]|nr:MAG: 50S ribosomal protein L24 [Nevskiaceae bacterium]